MISVILPIYNVELYLIKCLFSILNNSYRDLEVICVNDGSTDRCPQILRGMQKLDPRIIVINQENQGLMGARNSGLEAANGEYIAFIDPDDWIHPLYFQSMLECMVQNNADMVVSGCRKFTLDEEIEPDLSSDPKFRKLTAKEFYNSYYARHMIWGRLLRKKDTASLRFPPEVFSSQDTMYNLRLLAGIKHPVVYETDTEMYYYLQRPGSLVHCHPYETIIEIAKWYKAHARDPHHLRTGDWGWMLLMQSVTMTLSCRNSARLWKNYQIVQRCNSLLRLMVLDMLKDRFISPGYKITRTVMSVFPDLYRLFQLIIDPTMLDYEKDIREQRSANN